MIIHFNNSDNADLWLADPNEAQIPDAINALDGIIKLMVILNALEGLLFIHCGTQLRMHVSYATDRVRAYLTDESETSVQMLEFTHGNGQIDDWPLRDTISKEQALEVALHFFRKRTFPKGFHWVGDADSVPVVSD